VKAGRPYSTGFGFVHIDEVRTVRVADVKDADAREAGLRNASALIDLVRSHTGATVSPDTLLYRVEFHYLSEPPPRPALSVDEIETRLARMDSLSRRGPWTLDTLRLIEANPGVVARRLAAQLDWPTTDFKAQVRKLKALGLTVSLDVGYALSELGQDLVDSLAVDDQPA
jgi:hypothetical protein